MRPSVPTLSTERRRISSRIIEVKLGASVEICDRTIEDLDIKARVQREVVPQPTPVMRVGLHRNNGETESRCMKSDESNARAHVQ
jgi:hypothetical protein